MAVTSQLATRPLSAPPLFGNTSDFYQSRSKFACYSIVQVRKDKQLEEDCKLKRKCVSTPARKSTRLAQYAGGETYHGHVTTYPFDVGVGRRGFIPAHLPPYMVC